MTKRTSMKDPLDAILDDADLPSRDVPICFAPALVAEYQQVERNRRRDSLSDKATDQKLASLRKKIDAKTVVFTLQAMERHRWTQFIAEHPERPDNKEDKAAGYNTETFWEAIVPECLVAPKVTPAQWEKLNKKLSNAQWQKLTAATMNLNLTETAYPF